ncbi:hypothetical protein pb186bvf_013696 [Paramecium bursaria]
MGSTCQKHERKIIIDDPTIYFKTQLQTRINFGQYGLEKVNVTQDIIEDCTEREEIIQNEDRSREGGNQFFRSDYQDQTQTINKSYKFVMSLHDKNGVLDQLGDLVPQQQQTIHDDVDYDDYYQDWDQVKFGLEQKKMSKQTSILSRKRNYSKHSQHKNS